MFVTWPLRYRFDEEGLFVRGLLGRRRVRWGDVRLAKLDRHKSFCYLWLVHGRIGWCLVPLDDFRQAASLYQFIAERLPVPVRGAEYLARHLRDEEQAVEMIAAEAPDGEARERVGR
jgi:hypothetical protein